MISGRLLRLLFLRMLREAVFDMLDEAKPFVPGYGNTISRHRRL